MGEESFNEAIDSWDVSNATNMEGMFAGAKEFKQDISSWWRSSANITPTNKGDLFKASYGVIEDYWDNQNMLWLGILCNIAFMVWGIFIDQ